VTTSATEAQSTSLSEPRSGFPRLLASVRSDGQPVSLEEHIRWYDTPGSATHGRELIPIVESSGLRGRGGAGFPAGTKFHAVATAKGRPVVVANGAEGEPASGKDRALLRAAPQLVLDGAVLAATAVGAGEAIVTVSASAATERRVLGLAIEERKRARVDGRIRLRLAVVPDGFVTGEETALVQFLNGGSAKPTFVPPRPFERGVGGAPTLVQNVETLAHVALLARYGSRWFRAVGTAAEPGSALVTVSGAVERAGVHEVPFGMRFVELLDEVGGLTEPAAAFLVGGYFGTWFDATSVPELALCDESLARYGGGLGTGVIVALPRSTCAVSEVARVASYLANESAGQCGPCVHGLRAIANGFCRIAAGDADERARLERWAAEVRGRGACKHPDGGARFVGSALNVFRDEIETHLRYGRCGAQDRQVLRVSHRTAQRR
jgi:NADH:ubiquinone oxidoreductase subunit F (NADH-binding)